MTSLPAAVFKSPFSKRKNITPKLSFLPLAVCLLLSFGADPAPACTLFAAAGSRVEGGGTLIAKNRDRPPRLSVLEVRTPPDGYRYLALVAADLAHKPAVAGINEKGLVVVGATAGSLANKDESGAKGLTQTLLKQCATVDEVLARRELLRAAAPVFQALADGRKIAVIEVAPQGRVALKVTDQGTLCHTNHYLDPQFQEYNQKPNISSLIRYCRIDRLLSLQIRPFTLEDFLACSQDRHDGPDNSIWRTGSAAAKARTLATWIVAQLPGAAPHLYIVLANPDEPQKILNLKLEPSLWKKGLNDKIFTLDGGR
jgi:hypothetical protein